jgi:hypothetical protein
MWKNSPMCCQIFTMKRCLFFICALYFTGSVPYLFLSTLCWRFWNFNTYFDIFLITYIVRRSDPDPEPLLRFWIWPGQQVPNPGSTTLSPEFQLRYRVRYLVNCSFCSVHKRVHPLKLGARRLKLSRNIHFFLYYACSFFDTVRYRYRYDGMIEVPHVDAVGTGD